MKFMKCISCQYVLGVGMMMLAVEKECSVAPRICIIPQSAWCGAAMQAGQ